MSEVTEGELVMWSVDPGPMAGALELKLWRIATAARSYLNRMRAAELAHGVAAGERDAVTVERDEAKEACDLLEMERDDACGKLDDLRADLHNVRAHSVAAEEARDLAIVERDEAYKQRDFAKTQLDWTTQERDTARVSRDEARQERDEAHAKSQEWDAMLTGARARQRALESQIEDARAILGAAPDEMLSDAARRVVEARDSLTETDPHKTVLDEVRKVMGLQVGESVVDRVKDFRRTEVLIFEARKHLEPLVSDPSGDIEDLAMMVAHRIAHTVSPTDDRDLRQILRARDGESLKDAARRVAVGAEPPQVFRPPISVTVSNAGGMVFAEIAVGDITDPAFIALSGHHLSRLGLVVCDG